MPNNFGEWSEKLRIRLGVSQTDFAHLVGLKSYQAVANWKSKREPKLRPQTRQCLMDLIGASTVAEFDRIWRSGQVPAHLKDIKDHGKNGIGLDEDASRLLRVVSNRVQMRPDQWVKRIIKWFLAQPDIVKSIIETSLAEQGESPSMRIRQAADERHPPQPES